jgi:ATP-dependent Clp protease adaptor protein ClpS
MQVLTDTDVEILDKTIETDLKKLVVYNDDINTFDWVIDTLITVCRHSNEQAEQSTLIIHFKGKCAVKEGEFDELAGMRNEICRRGISAEIH